MELYDPPAEIVAQVIFSRILSAVQQYADPEVRAVAVIGRLLLATREKWAGDALRVAGPQGDVRKAADMLLALAKDLPESSYAPYAAYYAACCYGTLASEQIQEQLEAWKAQQNLRDASAEMAQSSALVRENEYCARASKGLTLASGGADDYLKPRALYQLAQLRWAEGRGSEAEDLFKQAEDVLPGERIIEAWTKRTREDMARLESNAKEINE